MDEKQQNILRDLSENTAQKQLDLRDPLTKKEPKRKPQNADSIFSKKVWKGDRANRPQKISDIKSPNPQKSKVTNHYEQVGLVPSSRTIVLREALKVATGGSLILFFLIVLSITYRGFQAKDQFTSAAIQGFDGLSLASDATKQMDIDSAEDAIYSAQEQFQEINQDIWFLNQTLSAPGVGSELPVIGAKAIAIGNELSLAIEQALSALKNSEEIYDQFLRGSNYPSLQNKSLTEDLKQRLEKLNQSARHISQAHQLFQEINPEQAPEKYRDTLISAREKVERLNQLVTSFTEHAPAILKLLGDRYPHRYLILLQNNSEARPTGGFIGSFIIADTNDGYLTKLDFRDVYDADGQLHEEIPAPEEIAQLTDNWRLRDSNYSPDFAISAQKAAWFLEKSKGPGVDTIIAINQSIIKDLLEITGPIQLEDFDQPVTAENYHIILTYLVESKWAGATTPKDVIKNLIPRIQEKLLTRDNLPKLLDLGLKQAKRKEILAYSKDSQIQEFFQKVGISGQVHQSAKNEDYLSVSVVSIGGNKSDRYIKQRIFHHTYFQNDGSIINELTLSRTHTFSPDLERQWKKTLASFGFEEPSQDVIHIMGKGENKSAIKVYVPAGSELVDVIGLNREDVAVRDDQELNKTYFYYQQNVFPQNESTVTLRYRLPFKFDSWPSDTYRLIVQKQPGFISTVDFEKKIILNSPLEQYRIYPEGWEEKDGTITHRTNLLYDRIFAGVWGR